MLPFRSSGARKAAVGALFATVISPFMALAADPSPSPRKKDAGEKPASSLARIPLPIGQEAKGLVLPDFDVEGHLRARFEAGTAKRLDVENVELKALKMTTFTPQNTIDLLIEMPLSTLNLETQVIASRARTTVSRSDFTIAGDAMTFDTIGRKGTLVGNVKMVIKGQPPAARDTGQ